LELPLTRHEERYEQALQVAGPTPTGDKAVDEEAARKVLQSKSMLGVPWIEPVEVAPGCHLVANPEEANRVKDISHSFFSGAGRVLLTAIVFSGSHLRRGQEG